MLIEWGECSSIWLFGECASTFWLLNDEKCFSFPIRTCCCFKNSNPIVIHLAKVLAWSSNNTRLIWVFMFLLLKSQFCKWANLHITWFIFQMLVIKSQHQEAVLLGIIFLSDWRLFRSLWVFALYLSICLHVCLSASVHRCTLNNPC